MVEILSDRWAEFDALTLHAGAHLPNHTFCVMEAVAYVAGEEWSDHPECVSPVLGAFCRSWNDALDDKTRQRLKPYIPRLVGTNTGKRDDEKRAWMATDWIVREHAPAFLRLAGLTEHAKALESLAALTTAKRATKTQPALAAAWNAARAAAWNAAVAGAAVRAAAGAAAGTAAVAGTAARAVARDAARTAVRAAAGAAAAAGDAAGDAARDAARAALAPTVKQVQESAFRLLDRMIDAGQKP